MKDVPLVKTVSWSTTGLEIISQFSASNSGLIRRSRSSARRFWLAYKRTRGSISNCISHLYLRKTHGHTLLHPIQVVRDADERSLRIVGNMTPVTRGCRENVRSVTIHHKVHGDVRYLGAGGCARAGARGAACELGRGGPLGPPGGGGPPLLCC